MDHALSIQIILSHTASIHVYTVSCSCMYVKIQGKPICTMFLPLHLEEIKCIQPVLYTFFKIILQCTCILMTDQLQKDAVLMALKYLSNNGMSQKLYYMSTCSSILYIA